MVEPDSGCLQGSSGVLSLSPLHARACNADKRQKGDDPCIAEVGSVLGGR